MKDVVNISVRQMPKYYDDMGNDVSNWVKTLKENEKLIEAYKDEILKLKAETKRLKSIKRKEIEE